MEIIILSAAFLIAPIIIMRRFNQLVKNSSEKPMDTNTCLGCSNLYCVHEKADK